MCNNNNNNNNTEYTRRRCVINHLLVDATLHDEILPFYRFHSCGAFGSGGGFSLARWRRCLTPSCRGGGCSVSRRGSA